MSGMESHSWGKDVQGRGLDRAGNQIELVTDTELQVLFYLDLRERNTDGWAWDVAFMVDRVAAYLDFYGHTHFRSFDLQFQSVRHMLAGRKLKDRNVPPYRG